MISIDDLPSEIIVYILQTTRNISSIASFTATCKNYHEYVKEPLVWKWMIPAEENVSEIMSVMSLIASKPDYSIMNFLQSKVFCIRFMFVFCYTEHSLTGYRNSKYKTMYIPCVYTMSEITAIGEAFCEKENIPVHGCYIAWRREYYKYSYVTAWCKTARDMWQNEIANADKSFMLSCIVSCDHHLLEKHSSLTQFNVLLEE
jgi:hypothetical protein